MNKRMFMYLWLLLICATTLHTESLLQYRGFIPTTGVGPSPNNPFEYHRLVRSDNENRNFEVYLPPGYFDPCNQDVTYPVWYFLHGFGQNFSSYACIFPLLDQMIAAGTLPPMIIVKVDGSLSTATDGTFNNGYLGSFYLNSAFNGNFEDYIIQEVIPFIDANFRTKTDRANRGIAGHGMGGYGAVLLAFKNTNLFGAIVAHTPTDIVAMADAALKPDFYKRIEPEIPTSGADAGCIFPTNGGNTFELFAQSAALSPDLTRTFSVKLPIKVDANFKPVRTNGELTPDDEVLQTWFLNDPVTMLRTNANLRQALMDTKIYIDYGKSEEQICANGAIRLSDELSCHDIDHEMVVFQGTSFKQDCELTPSNNILLLCAFPALQKTAEFLFGPGLPSVPFLIDLVVRAVDIPFTDYNNISIQGNLTNFVNLFCTNVPLNDIREILINPNFLACLANEGIDPDQFIIDFFVVNQVLQFSPPLFNVVSDGCDQPLCSACKLFLPLPC